MAVPKKKRSLSKKRIVLNLYNIKLQKVINSLRKKNFRNILNIYYFNLKKKR